MTYTGRAYNDLKSSPHWIRSLCLAALVNYVPILNWNNYGHFIGWAREAGTDHDSPMPSYRVSGESFELGFHDFVVGLVTFIVVVILLVIPFVGVILGLVGFIVGGAFSNVMAIRCAKSGKLASAFQLKDVAREFKADLKGIFNATYIPMLVVLIAGLAVSAIYLGLLVFIIGGTVLFDPSISITSAFLLLGPVGYAVSLVYSYAMSWLLALIMAITFRAVGHWSAGVDHLNTCA